MPKLSLFWGYSLCAKKGTFLFNAFVLLSLNSLLLPPGSCFAWWHYQLEECWDVCYHLPKTAIFPHLCQPCCLWSCAEHWVREAIQFKNNPVVWLGVARALALQDNLQSQIRESSLPFQMPWKPSLRDTYLMQGIWTFQPVKEPGEWGGRYLLPMFIRDTRANLTVPRWQHSTSSHRLCFSSPSHDAFGTKVSGSVCHSTGRCSLFCGLGRKWRGFLRVLQVWGLCYHQERE